LVSSATRLPSTLWADAEVDANNAATNAATIDLAGIFDLPD
jgi:hypothetical protein